jgi:hypothetical protein
MNCLVLPKEFRQLYQQLVRPISWSQKFEQMVRTLQQIATESENRLLATKTTATPRKITQPFYKILLTWLPVDTRRNDPDLQAIVALQAQAYNRVGRERNTLLTAFLRDAQAFRIWTL